MGRKLRRNERSVRGTSATGIRHQKKNYSETLRDLFLSILSKNVEHRRRKRALSTLRHHNGMIQMYPVRFFKAGYYTRACKFAHVTKTDFHRKPAKDHHHVTTPWKLQCILFHFIILTEHFWPGTTLTNTSTSRTAPIDSTSSIDVRQQWHSRRLRRGNNVDQHKAGEYKGSYYYRGEIKLKEKIQRQGNLSLRFSLYVERKHCGLPCLSTVQWTTGRWH